MDSQNSTTETELYGSSRGHKFSSGAHSFLNTRSFFTCRAMHARQELRRRNDVQIVEGPILEMKNQGMVYQIGIVNLLQLIPFLILESLAGNVNFCCYNFSTVNNTSD